jgi:hypothetical protein
VYFYFLPEFGTAISLEMLHFIEGKKYAEYLEDAKGLKVTNEGVE